MEDDFASYLQARREAANADRRAFWREFFRCFLELLPAILIIAAVLYYTPQLDAYYSAQKVSHE